MVAAGKANLDRLLGVKVLGYLRLGLEQSLLQPRGKPGLRDIDDQARYLCLAGQLPQHCAERLLDLCELLFVGVVISRFELLVVERGLEVDLFGALSFELRGLVLDDLPVHPEARHQHEHDADHGRTENQRPTADIVQIQALQFLDQIHLQILQVGIAAHLLQIDDELGLARRA